MTVTVQSVAVLLVLRFVVGMAATAWDLARKAWMSIEVPKRFRGRISSTMAGLNKLTIMASAILSGMISQNLSIKGIFVLQACISFLALASMNLHFFLERPPAREVAAARDPSPADNLSISLREVAKVQ